jgi:photosystem II stability/assembly factor-like uncharacterized protein
MTELLVGTRKGLFVLEGEAGSAFEITTRAFEGDPVDYAMREAHSGRVYAAVTSPFWGPRIWFTDDVTGEWESARGVSLPKGGDQALKRVWVITASDDGSRLWAGGDPGVLFSSRDGGASWEHGNAGIVADYLPEQARATAVDLCVHHLERAPRRPERLFMQFHGGVYRSDDAGRSWIDIAAGLPSDFGFPVVTDSADPDSAYVIPVSTVDRVTPDGRELVWETRDAGATWTSHGDGLPAENAYLQVLRQSFTTRGEGSRLELYFGATAGEIFGSGDAGRTWFTVASRLPAIASVRVGS